VKIVHIGTADNRGGAARAAFQLHESLLRSGHESRMLVNQRFEDRPEIARIGFSGSFAGRALNRALLEGERLTGLQNLLQPRRRAFLDHAFVRNADIIQLHNLHGNFFPHTVLPRLSRIAPLVWTLHDTWALTGHCAYNYDCERWRTGCGSCPRLSEYPPIAIDTSAVLWSIKKKAYAQADVTIVAPSRWLARMAAESPLLAGHEVHCIPYSVDTSVFAPIPQLAARRELGIAPEARVLTAMVMPGGERKGPQFLSAALAKMTSGDVMLLTAGGGTLDTPPGTHVRHIGAVDSRRQMNLCYAAADVFVLPTLADNLPVSILESFASGTPAAAFDVGGVPDLVVTGETGRLVRAGDVDELAGALDALLFSPDRLRDMRVTCRARAVSEYAPQIQAERYLRLYQDRRERRRQRLRDAS
jgi:glycosyltransferase involved in cell wall biosynthesis